MRLAELRKILPDVEIEDDPYSIGYWLRCAGQRKPRDEDRQVGWDQADAEIAQENAGGPPIEDSAAR